MSNYGAEFYKGFEILPRKTRVVGGSWVCDVYYDGDIVDTFDDKEKAKEHIDFLASL